MFLSMDSLIEVDRSYKGKSLIETINDYCVFDITTTGYISDLDLIVEISSLRIRDGRVIDSYNVLINHEIDIEPFLFETTGLTNDFMNKVGINQKDAISGFFKFIGDDVIITHYNSFGLNFLYDYSYKNGFILKNDFIDTFRLLRHAYPNLESYSLRSVANSFGIETNISKRSIYDVSTIFKLYESIKGNFVNYEDSKRVPLTLKERIEALSITNISHDNQLVNNKVFVFTGSMDTITRIDACELVIKLGGIVETSITRKVDYVVLGGRFTHTKDKGKSNKLKKAEELVSKGHDLKIIDEFVFKAIIEDN